MAQHTKKLSVSFPPALADAVRRAAERRSGGNVSAWLAEVAEGELLREEARAAVAEWEAEHGEFTAEERAEARRRWLD